MYPQTGAGFPATTPFDWQAYRNRDFSSHSIANYGVTPAMIQSNASTLFRKYDFDQSGSLSFGELFPLLNEFMMFNGLRMVAPDDVLALMAKYDSDRSGTIDYNELEMVLAELGGQRIAPSMLQQYRAMPNRTTVSWRSHFGY